MKAKGKKRVGGKAKASRKASGKGRARVKKVLTAEDAVAASDARLASSARAKVKDGKSAGRAELDALRRHDKRERLDVVLDALRRVPQEQLIDLLGASRKVIREWEAAGMLRNVGTRLVTYDLFVVVPWLKDRWTGKHRSESSLVETDRARIFAAKATGLELDLGFKKGALVDAAAVRDRGKRLVEQARTKLLSVPSKVAGRCVGLEAQEIEGEMSGALREALEGLAALGTATATATTTTDGTDGRCAPVASG